MNDNDARAAIGTSDEDLGRLVRETWVQWAREQDDPKPSWLASWDELDAGQREVDIRIGKAVAAVAAEHCAQAILAHMAAREPWAPPGDPNGDLFRRAALAWRRHFQIAARVAAGAFMTDEDLKQAAAAAVIRGDYAARFAPGDQP